MLASLCLSPTNAINSIQQCGGRWGTKTLNGLNGVEKDSWHNYELSKSVLFTPIKITAARVLLKLVLQV